METDGWFLPPLLPLKCDGLALTADCQAELLAVAERLGRTQTELALEVGLTLGAVSRAVNMLGTTGRRDKRGAPGMGWIEAVADPDDDRNLLVHLLPKGRDLLKQLDQELG